MILLSDERTSKVARYSLIAESMNSGYTSVPETPWPILMMATVLTLGVVALRRKEFHATSRKVTVYGT